METKWKIHARDGKDNRVDDAGHDEGTRRALIEATEAEALLEKAAALTKYAVAGLSAFHGRFCLMAGRNVAVPDDARKCQDPKCRAWAAALMNQKAPACSYDASHPYAPEHGSVLGARVGCSCAPGSGPEPAWNEALEAADEVLKTERQTGKWDDWLEDLLSMLEQRIRALKRGG